MPIPGVYNLFRFQQKILDFFPDCIYNDTKLEGVL